ncbi:MAG TPA: flagellar export chaperone FlgN [Solirubrobacteraceae bacterium]|nr:flagellar export chaperone FlgN [Solirubrobacteraceae bacterium]
MTAIVEADPLVSDVLTRADEGGRAPISAIVEAHPLDSDVLAHLDAQIASVNRLLEIVLEQGAAIRARDVHTVVRLAGLLHGELLRRQQIERTRSELLERAGERLGIPAPAVTLTRLGALMRPPAAHLAQERSAHLRGLVAELRREHACNRALMQIELSFLDHLMKSLALDGSTHSYDPRGLTTTGARAASHGGMRVLDLHA